MTTVKLSNKTGYDPKTCHYLIDKLLELDYMYAPVYIMTIAELTGLIASSSRALVQEVTSAFTSTDRKSVV